MHEDLGCSDQSSILVQAASLEFDWLSSASRPTCLSPEVVTTFHLYPSLVPSIAPEQHQRRSPKPSKTYSKPWPLSTPIFRLLFRLLSRLPHLYLSGLYSALNSLSHSPSCENQSKRANGRVSADLDLVNSSGTRPAGRPLLQHQIPSCATPEYLQTKEGEAAAKTHLHHHPCRPPARSRDHTRREKAEKAEKVRQNRRRLEIRVQIARVRGAPPMRHSRPLRRRFCIRERCESMCKAHSS
jgi:hypothetical protein